MPQYVVSRLTEALSANGKPLHGSRILLLGLAYKKDVDDLRESPSLFLLEKLEKAGAHVEFHDSHFPVIPPTREHGELTGRTSAPIDKAALAGYDAVIIATEHSDVDYADVVAHSKLVVDTRNATRNVADKSRIIKA